MLCWRDHPPGKGSGGVALGCDIPFCQRAYAPSCSFKFQRCLALPVPYSGEAFSVYNWLVSWPWLRTPLQLDSALLGLLSQPALTAAGKKTKTGVLKEGFIIDKNCVPGRKEGNGCQPEARDHHTLAP